jgi:integrase/recombinase XerD
LALAELYFRTQVVGSSPSTVDAKRRDLERFLSFYLELYAHDRPGEWYSAVTRDHLSELGKARKPGGSRYSDSWVCRNYSTIRHFARWAHRNAIEFPMGCPKDGVKPPDEPEGEFKGLERRDLLRIFSAAESLCRRPQRGLNTSIRDRALVHALCASARRVSEVVALDFDQYDGRAFLRVRRSKGSKNAKRIALTKEVRSAIDAWVKERGTGVGPLLCTSGGRPVTRSNVCALLKRLERMANAHLPESERLEVTPHVLLHTRLRRIAEEKNLPYAKKLSGHISDWYIWRYTAPSEEEFEREIEHVD